MAAIRFSDVTRQILVDVGDSPEMTYGRIKEVSGLVDRGDRRMCRLLNFGDVKSLFNREVPLLRLVFEPGEQLELMSEADLDLKVVALTPEGRLGIQKRGWSDGNNDNAPFYMQMPPTRLPNVRLTCNLFLQEKADLGETVFVPSQILRRMDFQPARRTYWAGAVNRHLKSKAMQGRVRRWSNGRRGQPGGVRTEAVWTTRPMVDAPRYWELDHLEAQLEQVEQAGLLVEDEEDEDNEGEDEEWLTRFGRDEE